MNMTQTPINKTIQEIYYYTGGLNQDDWFTMKTFQNYVFFMIR